MEDIVLHIHIGFEFFQIDLPCVWMAQHQYQLKYKKSISSKHILNKTISV